MPRYFFDVSDGRCAADAEGVEFKDSRLARIEAIRRAAMLLKASSSRPDIVKNWRIALRDEDGSMLYWIDSSKEISLASP